MTITNLSTLALSLLLISGCAATDNTNQADKPTNTAVATTCEEPRPQICTMEYRPVCATLENDERKTFGSACSACGNGLVQAHRPGACED
ncbi:hypothetical protein [Oceanicoccus sagamiensis]|uniref:Kazal-like domain-containing protein n=1 Tax=Oceanicoccus sagamiensis TaxID=716816 RepID=A0A1X9NBY9_9GAMM|nr:hypothetical protein [Oceanicoccus sagamiensis]ARN73952.1 hypothetical protein BST96_07375 [Oceanicoccus sagamiensis]